MSLFLSIACTVAAETQNTAVIPVMNPRPAKTGEYDWLKRHEEVKKLCASIGNIDIIFIGDSIFHYFAGNPRAKYVRGAIPWNKYFGKYDVVNMGFGCDRTQHLLWRIDHGEVDGISPKVAVLMIGTNNIGGGTQSFHNTPEEISNGIKSICKRLREKLPHTKILLVGILPRSSAAQTSHWRKFRKAVKEVNRLVSSIGKEDESIHFLDIGDKFIREDESISREVMSDYLHPTEKGYEIFADSISPLLAESLESRKTSNKQQNLMKDLQMNRKKKEND